MRLPVGDAGDPVPGRRARPPVAPRAPSAPPDIDLGLPTLPTFAVTLPFPSIEIALPELPTLPALPSLPDIDLGLPSLPSFAVSLPFPDIEIGIPELPALPSFPAPNCPFDE